MGKLSEVFKNLIEKVKNMSLKSKIAFGVLFLGIIISVISLVHYTNANKYGLLFQVENTEDGKIITQKLTEKKIETKIDGNSIYVPKEKVDQLRLELAPELTNGSKGYELLDSGSQFGKTDAEFQLEKQRVLQGELEKTIKSFSQVQNARVHITLPQDSVFVKDSTPGKAAVYLQLKTGAKLSNDQVKSIVALVSGSVQNMPPKNVEVMDDKMNLLSKGIFDDEQGIGTVSKTALDNQTKAETDFEQKLEKQLIDLLGPALGKDKVKIKINADLDFDSKEKSTLTYDPNKVEVSTHIIKGSSNSANSAVTQSPVDSNANNTIANTNGAGSTNTNEESTVNYNVGKTETKTISAPGEVRRLTASVMVDGNLSDATKAEIQKAVGGVIGFRADRGDEISVVSMAFDSSANSAAQAEIVSLKEETAKKEKMALYRNIAIGGGALLALIAGLIVVLVRRRKRKAENSEEITDVGLDVVIGDEIAPKKIDFESLDLEPHDERSHIEGEVRKYATDKPEQVVDIVKSWLSEDER